MMNFIGTLNDVSFLDLDLDTFVIGNKKYAVRMAALFDDEMISYLVSKIHDLNKKVYVCVNKLFTQEEIEGLEEYLINLNKLSVDGILFSDMAVYQIAKRNGFANLLIYDPDTLLVNSYDVNFYKGLGLESVVVSKDISLEDIFDVAKRNPLFATILVYGHYTLFYSKRKLVENYFYAYEKDPKKYIENRNLLTQEITRNEMYPIYQDDNGTVIYSDKKLFYANYLKKMHEVGINRFYFNFMFDNFDEAKRIISIYKESLEVNKTYDEEGYTTGYLFRKTGVK